MARKKLAKSRIVGSDVVDARELTPHPDNWRTHPVEQLLALETAIERVGWVDEVIVSKRTGRVLNGHARVAIALREGSDHLVPVSYVDLDENEELEVLATFDALTSMAAAEPDRTESLADFLRGLEEERYERLIEALEAHRREPPDVPVSFTARHEVEVQYECPKCHFGWSGSPRPSV